MATSSAPPVNSLRIVAPPPPRRRPVLWILAVLAVLIGAALGVYAFLGGGATAVLGYLPGDADAIVVLDWQKLLKTKGFGKAQAVVRQYFMQDATLDKVYMKVPIKKIETVAVALKGGDAPGFLIIAKGVFEKGKLAPVFEKELGLKPSPRGKATVWARKGNSKDPAIAMFGEQVVAVGSPGIVDQAVGFALGQPGSADTNKGLRDLLGAVDKKGLILGSVSPSSEAQSALAKTFGGAKLKHASFSVDEKESALHILSAMGFSTGPEASKAKAALDKKLAGVVAGIQKNTLIPAALRALAKTVSTASKMAVKHAMVTADTKLKMSAEQLMKLIGDVAIPGFVRYQKEVKTKEAVANTQKLFDAAVAYYKKDRFPPEDDKKSARRRRRRRAEPEPLPKRFPDSVGPSPKGNPCDQDEKKFQPDAKVWENPKWKAVGFALGSPHYYRYSIESSGEGPEAKFTVRASGDLDCNGEWSTFERSGSIDPTGKVVGGKLIKKDPLE